MVKGSEIENHKKIVIPLGDSWHGKTAETVWAIELEKNIYEIDNTPFIAYGISYKDIVRCEKVDGRLVVNSIISKSGYSTCRFFFKNLTYENRKEYLNLIEKYGEIEYFKDMDLYAIDINDNNKLKFLLSLLNELESKNILGYEEADINY